MPVHKTVLAALLTFCSATSFSLDAAAAIQDPAKSPMDIALSEGDISEVQTYLEAQRRVRKEIEEGRAYRKLDDSARDRLFRAQERLASMLADVQSFDQLELDRKIDVRNAQQEVRAALLEARDQREVCWRERAIGSMIAETRCATQAQLDVQREASRSYMEKQRTCAGGESCGDVPFGTF